jgi:hypothetical protein
MSAGRNKRHLFDDPRNVGRVVRGLLFACIVLAGLDMLVHRHVSHPWEGIVGFYALYGFVACVLLVLLAKEMRKLLMRDEDYYERDRGDPPPPAEGNDDA